MKNSQRKMLRKTARNNNFRKVVIIGDYNTPKNEFLLMLLLPESPSKKYL